MRCFSVVSRYLRSEDSWIRIWRLLAALILAALTAPALAGDGDWNQFRGPTGDGVSTVKGLPVTFAEGSPEVVWKVPVPGRAWSSPVVWGDQIWVTNAPEIQNPEGATNQNSFSEGAPPLKEPLRFSAECYDFNTGRKLHDVTCCEISQPQYTHPTNSYASPTPWIEEGRLYVHFGSYGTACIDTTTGKKLWERTDIECHHWRGPGSSPVVSGNRLFLCFDGFDKQFIMALDKRDGSTLWKRDREVDYGTDNGDRKKAYGTPRVIEVGGRELVVSPYAMATTAYDAETGDSVWTVIHDGMNAGARPLYGNGLLYISAGSGDKHLIALRPDGQGDVTATHIAWASSKSIPNRPSQILIGDLLFMMNDEGVCSCVDALTGEYYWTKRISSRYWASPLYADGLLYFFSQEGLVPVIKASREFEQVAENKLEAEFNASPAVAGRSLILRSATHLYRIQRAQ